MSAGAAPGLQDSLNAQVASAKAQLAQLFGTPPETFSQFSELIEREARFWSENLPDLGEPGTWFLQAKQFLTGARQNILADAGQGVARAVGVLYQNRSRLIVSTQPEAQFLRALFGMSPTSAKAGLAYLRGDSIAPVVREQIDGFVAGVLFRHPDLVTSGIKARLAILDDKISGTESLLKEGRDQLARWHNETGEFREASQNQLESLRGKQEALFRDLNDNMSNGFEQAQKQREGEFQALRQELTSLKAAYDEHLKLSAPVRYWEELQRSYELRGWLWMAFTAGAASLVFWSVSQFVYNPPALLSEPVLTLTTIKGTVLIGLAISIAIYVITILVRLTLSCFHLARDAQERRQLTHVFLALVKESAIEAKEDRGIILSSLFSRADTGLLKGDSTPAFPTPLGALLDSLKLKG